MRIRTDLLIERLNWAFSAPFLPEGFFQARHGHKGGVKLHIGDVDLELDSTGEIVNHGKWVGPGCQWTILNTEVKSGEKHERRRLARKE